MLVDGKVPMGAVNVSSVRSRRLTATATRMPSGSVLQILQGKVDYAGRSSPTPNTRVIGSYTPSQVIGGKIHRTIDTTSSSFLRTQVLSSTGAMIATSNPVWLLRHAPPNHIPRRRQS